jgi:hypothetical protein
MTSILRTIPKEELQKIFDKSSSYSLILQSFDLRSAGGNFNTLKSVITDLNIDLTKFRENRLSVMRDSFRKRAATNDEIFIKNGSHSRNAIKKAMLRNGLEGIECSLCQQGRNWNGKPLTLQLDHINGIANDHRLENLRWLCPNCHSQTDTFAGKGRSKIVLQNKLHKCKKVFKYKTKIEWPSDSELSKLVWEIPRSKLALQLGISDKAIAKHCKKHGISQPSRGYWMKQI